jgi:Ca2+-binding RTX toxin-like protein
MVHLQINGLNPGVTGVSSWPNDGHDQLVATQGVTLRGVELDITMGFVPEEDDHSFVIVDNQGGGPISGTFIDENGTPIVQDQIITRHFGEFQVDYTGGDGNDVELTYIGIAPGVYPFVDMYGDSQLLLGGTPGQDSFYLFAQGTTNLSIDYRLDGGIQQSAPDIDPTAFSLDFIQASLKQGRDVLFTDNLIWPVDVDGGDGDDRINTGTGDDFIDAAGGNNTIHTSGGNNTIVATDGNDIVYSGDGDDIIDVGDGTNTVRAGDGNNIITAGDGRNSITTGSGMDDIEVGSGSNYVRAGAGDDRVEVVAVGTGTNTFFGYAGNDVLIGGGGIDRFYGGNDDDLLIGLAGNDTLRGDAGDDVLSGGDGKDYLYGGYGNNVLIGGTGGDLLYGYTGEDLLIAGSTTHDMDEAALLDIVAEWSNTAVDQATRRANLAAGVGGSGAALVAGTTVFDDADIDRLYGSRGSDWFWANELEDVLGDFRPADDLLESLA